ncbi:HutD family protein [Streptomyces sp. MS2.AVA.5]|uniref:HutD family protein n=1 Tax=Streptomyces achmelvichensis TaxID=3134111 RepID=A0ACC6PSM7_9ACTN
MTARLLRADSRRAVPWKNGGGTTREVAVAPDGAGTDDFDWRISLADVGVDGPFSAFPGVERILTVADGAGMELTVGGERTVADQRYRPYAFPGDVPTDGRLLGGPVVNFNVMYRRDRTECRTSVVRGEAAPEVPPGSTVVVVALDGTTAVGDTGLTLERYDAVLLDGPPGPLRTEGHAAVVVLRSL